MGQHQPAGGQGPRDRRRRSRHPPSARAARRPARGARLPGAHGLPPAPGHRRADPAPRRRGRPPVRAVRTARAQLARDPRPAGRRRRGRRDRADRDRLAAPVARRRRRPPRPRARRAPANAGAPASPTVAHQCATVVADALDDTVTSLGGRRATGGPGSSTPAGRRWPRPTAPPRPSTTPSSRARRHPRLAARRLDRGLQHGHHPRRPDRRHDLRLLTPCERSSWL